MMFTTPKAIAHTYYLPHRDVVTGPAAPELAGLLHRLWTACACGAPSRYEDGVSAWLDEEGCVWAAVVHDRAVDWVTEIGALREALRALQAARSRGKDLTRRVA